MASTLEMEDQHLVITDVEVSRTKNAEGKHRVRVVLENGHKHSAFFYKDDPPVPLHDLIGITYMEAALKVARAPNS